MLNISPAWWSCDLNGAYYSAGVELATPPVFYVQHISGHHLSCQTQNWSMTGSVYSIRMVPFKKLTYCPIQDDQHGDVDSFNMTNEYRSSWYNLSETY